jgi:hypothetical protein
MWSMERNAGHCGPDKVAMACIALHVGAGAPASLRRCDAMIANGRNMRRICW